MSMELNKESVEQVGANVGHGHVFPRADGVKMRCGGPALCSECAADAYRARAALAHRAPEVCSECSDTGKVYDESGDGPWSCYACTGNPEVIGYANGDELDNMLDDRTAVLSPGKTSFHTVPVYRLIRAALAQPSPVRSSLLINGYQLRAALDFIAPDGTAEQLKSEACIEWRQQDADFLEAGLYAFCAEYPEEGGVLLDEEPTTAQPYPLQSEQAEAERPEVVARVVHSNPVVLGQCGPLNANDELMTVAQHAASVARWAEMFNRVEQERDAALARVAELESKLAELEKQEPVALANRGNQCFWVKWTEAAAGLYGPGIKLYAAPVAQAQQLNDLDKQCRDDVARALGLRPNQERGFAWSYLLASIKSCVKASEDSAKAQHSVPIAPQLKRALGLVVAALEADGDRPTSKYALSELKKVLAAAPAQAHHSVPDGYRLIRLEHFAAIKAQLNPEQVDAYRGRNVYDEDKVYANWNACRSALDEIKDVFQQIDWDAENELADLLAAAPGKEVGHE
ncbi:hypothetical protein ACQ477_004574 [Pseudomonas aeruginosa]